MEHLTWGVEQLGLPLTVAQLMWFRLYQRELLEWNQHMNLTAIREPVEVEVKHFLDSLTVALSLPPEVRQGGRLLDVGSGGGFPGIPLKIAFPGLALALLDSVAKKTAFLQHLVQALKLEGVEVYTGRAEELAHRAGLRESFHAVVSRAVAPLPVLAELTLPFARVGGLVVAQKKGEQVNQEVREAAHALEVLGGRVKEVKPVEVEPLRDGRVLVVVEKLKPTPGRFPRRPGAPQKRPL